VASSLSTLVRHACEKPTSFRGRCSTAIRYDRNELLSLPSWKTSEERVGKVLENLLDFLRRVEFRELHGDGDSGRGPLGTCGYGDKVHGLTAGMGPVTRGHRGDGFNNLRGHRGHGVRA